VTNISTPDTLKMVREAICVAQTWLSGVHDTGQAQRASQTLGRLIEDIDRQRPLGPDGKHDDRHTATCGCEDGQLLPEVGAGVRMARLMAAFEYLAEAVTDGRNSTALRNRLAVCRAALEHGVQVVAYVKAGRCYRCGLRPPEPGYFTCEPCNVREVLHPWREEAPADQPVSGLRITVDSAAAGLPSPLFTPGDILTITDLVTGDGQPRRYRVVEPLDSAARIVPEEG
jgi:hypothetical protein